MSERGGSASASGSGGKRPRGRPLKNTGDEDDPTAKRRARVRKAQQAFKKRKEAAAQSLEDRLNTLQSGLEEFGREFSEFTASITDTGVTESHPDILRQLHSLTERLLALANIASPLSPTDEEDPAFNTPIGREGSQGPSGPADSGVLGAGQDRSHDLLSRLTPGVEHLFLSDIEPWGMSSSAEE